MSGRRAVTHVVETFVGPSQPWLYDLASSHVRYEATVVCASREQADLFPYPRASVGLPATKRWSRSWLHSNFARRLGWPRRPLNDWRVALGRLAPADIYHAHFGQVGWRLVDSGLAPVLTSFYGYDAGHSRVLGYWGRGYADLFARGAGVVAEGPAMRERLIALGAPADRSFVVPLIADIEGLEAESPDTDGPVRVLMAGRFVEKKGFVDGVAAFALAHRAGLAQELVIIGSGPEEGAIRGSVVAAGVESAVTIIPLAPRDRYREIMASCQIFLQPSKTSSDGDVEGGAPTTLLDAQALGRVLVTTDHADIPFVVDPDAAYIAREDDIRDLTRVLTVALSSRTEWADRGAVGRRHVDDQHSRLQVATRLEEVYDQVIARHRGPS